MRDEEHICQYLATYGLICTGNFRLSRSGSYKFADDQSKNVLLDVTVFVTGDLF